MIFHNSGHKAFPFFAGAALRERVASFFALDFIRVNAASAGGLTGFDISGMAESWPGGRDLGRKEPRPGGTPAVVIHEESRKDSLEEAPGGKLPPEFVEEKIVSMGNKGRA